MSDVHTFFRRLKATPVKHIFVWNLKFVDLKADELNVHGFVGWYLFYLVELVFGSLLSVS